MRILYFVSVALLSVIDALLLAKPNLLGKIGLWVYKYSYLRTFPRALVTVSIVVGATLLISELIVMAKKRKWMSKSVGTITVLIFTLASIGILAKVVMDFSHGSYSHTGSYFKVGVYLLPSILVFIFVTSLLRVVSKRK
jgi:hypothetical protein